MRTLLALFVSVLLVGCAAAEDGTPSTSPSSPSVASAPPVGPSVGEVRAPVFLGEVEISDTSPETLAELRAVPPERLVVDSLEIDMPVTSVGLEGDGAMEIPESAATAGWYRYGPAPGGEAGNAVLAAHVDDAVIGLGPFSRLLDIDEGARIVIDSADGTETPYEVTRVEKTDKREVDMGLVFDRAGPAQLVLVTCGGRFDWDTGHYEDNVVVYATPVNEPAR
ncbi:class F sortase [Demequina muriae]|uniref:Class F sortase n=1 Tax=Demequina muriae TaxID=3051664 RepID=A0ABT8GH13_9MICO|nr:class F sortase [Demequina sp. EGI L300058]MDN4480731.1 class F sortase [Demequina sp. EGI L300058]